MRAEDKKHDIIIMYLARNVNIYLSCQHDEVVYVLKCYLLTKNIKVYIIDLVNAIVLWGEIMSSKIYRITVKHDGLKKYKEITAHSKKELDEKKKIVLDSWEQEWAKKCEYDMKVKQQEYEQKMQQVYIYQKILSAQVYTDNLQEEHQEMLNYFKTTLNIPFNTDNLLNDSYFNISKPIPPQYESIPAEPTIADAEFYKNQSFMSKIFSKKVQEVDDNKKFENALEEWRRKKNRILQNNLKLQTEYELALKKWEENKEFFYNIQSNYNNSLKVLFDRLLNNPPKNDIEKYFQISIASLDMPIEYEHNFFVKFLVDSKTLIIEYFLPTMENISKDKEMIYNKNEDKYMTVMYSDEYLKQIYNEIVCQIVLAVINYVFKADNKYRLIDSIIFNGRVKKIDTATGKKIQPYILSIKTVRKDFDNLNLTLINAQSWLHNAQGTVMKDFTKETYINPIIKITEENNFNTKWKTTSISIYDVDKMDGHEFEYFCADLLKANGFTNVTVTRGSGDQGVDVLAVRNEIAYAIQCKNYSSSVGNTPIQEVCAGKIYYKCHVGVVMTNSIFTPGAIELANETNTLLWDRNKLIEMIETANEKIK